MEKTLIQVLISLSMQYFNRYSLMFHPCCQTYTAAPQMQALLPLCVTGASIGRICPICTQVTPWSLPSLSGTRTSATPSCGTFIPCGRYCMERSLAVTRELCLPVPTGNRAWRLSRGRIMCTALACCCSPRQGGIRCCRGGHFLP
jgi:hypothetical protein